MFIFIISINNGETSLMINKVSLNKVYNQQQSYTKETKQSHAVSCNNYFASPQQIAFAGIYKTLKKTALRSYLESKLKRTLAKIDLMHEALNSGTFKKDFIFDDESKDLLNYVARNTGIKVPISATKSHFKEVESLAAAKGINLSPEQKAKLLKRFDVSEIRKRLSNEVVESLEFLKCSKIFNNYSVVIQETIEKMNRAIRCFGLSQEVKSIVVNTEDNLGVKLDIPDSLVLAKNINERLTQHQKAGYTLPDEVIFNNFDFFATHNSELSAKYVNNTKPNNFDKAKGSHSTLENTKKQIYFNPVFLFSREERGDYNCILEDLDHELGHFWHNLKIGDDAYNSKEMNTIDGFLPKEDIGFLLDLKNKLSKKVCFIPNINIHGEEEENFAEIIPELQNMIEYRLDLGVEDIISDEVIARFSRIRQKLNEITAITLKQFPDYPEEVTYALTSPKELIAFSIQKSPYHKYDKEFWDILKKFGMPKIKEKQ